MNALRLAVICGALLAATACAELRGTGDLGIVVERATGSVQIIDNTARTSLASVMGLGDLSHASAVFSRDARYAFIFGRDGGLSKIDLLEHRITKRVIQAGNSIGGAISQDGKLVAVSNYQPGGIRIFDAATLDLVADIPAIGADGERSKTIGLVDAPGQVFVFGLYDAGEIWIVDMSDQTKPGITKIKDIGKLPYDGLITPNGRWYIAGLFGEDGMVMVDLWNIEAGAKRILAGYGRGNKKMPVYKMPHLEGWAMADGQAFFPAIGHHEVLVAEAGSWHQTAHIAVHGQPVFVMARPDGRQIWVNFAFPDNDTIQVIDVPSLRIVKTLKPGPAVLHMEFTPRGEEVWVSVRDADKVVVYDTETFEQRAVLPAAKPSGIFFSSRAHRIGL